MNKKAQTVIELMLLLAISVLALTIIYYFYSSQLELSSGSREASVAKSTINKLINSANSLSLAGAGSTQKVLIEIPADINISDSNINGNIIHFRLSNGSEVFGFSDVNIVGQFKKSEGVFVTDGYYVNLTFDGQKVIMSYDDFELNTNGIFVSAKQGTNVEKVFTVRNNSSRDAVFWLVNNFSFSSFAELDIDPSDVFFTLSPNETRVIDLNIILSRFSSGNYAGNISVIGEINDGVSDTNISKNIFVSVESFLEFEPIMIFQKSTSFSALSGTSTVKSYSLCNSTESNASISWERNSNPDANMLEWFTWPIVDNQGAVIANVASGDCAYFDLNFSVPLSAVTDNYDANITVTYDDGNSTSAYFFIDVLHNALPYSFFFSVSNNTLPANYFLSNRIVQNNDVNCFSASGELDWNVSAQSLELVSSNPLFDSSLVGLWHLNDKNSEGWVLNSASGIRDGLLSGGADTSEDGLWETKSVKFDGDGTKYINLGTSVTNPSLDLNQEFTVSAWINYKGGHSINAMSAIYSSEYYWSYNHGWTFHINDQVGTGVLEFAAGQNVIMGQGTSNVPQNTWTHVSMTRTLNNQIKLYINGALDAVRDLDPSYVITSTPDSPIRIGMRASQQDNDDFNGSIEEVAVWDRVLSPTEVGALYESQKEKRIDANLIAYYKLNSKNGTTIYDSANAFDGVLSGGADINGIGLWDSNALSLNGSTTYANLGSIFDVTGSSFTISSWFNPSSSNGVIVGMWGGGWSKFEINVSSGNISIYTANNSGPDYYVGCGTIVLNKWQHVLVVGNYSTGKVDCYLNGVGPSSGDLAPGTYVNGQWNIGGRVVGGAIQLLFSGEIDEVKIYNRALSALEIVNDYNSFLNAKFVDNNIIDASSAADWNSIKVNKDLNYSFGKEISVSEKFGDGLVGLWHMNNDSVDSSGNNFNGTWGGSEGYSTGLWGTNSANFDGATDYVSIPPINTGSGTGLTGCGWVKRPGALIGLAALFSFNNLKIRFTSDGRINDRAYNYLGNISSDYYSYNSIPLNKWTLVCVTYSTTGSNVVMDFYFDGLLDRSIVTDVSGLVGINSGGYIGMDQDVSSRKFSGFIEEASIWNRKLSDSEIIDLYRKGISQLDLNIYSCSDSTCTTKTSSQYISAVNNNEWNNLNSNLLNSRYLGFDAYFEKISDLEEYSAEKFYVSSFINDFNLYFTK